jgi:hypothetical protein
MPGIFSFGIEKTSAEALGVLRFGSRLFWYLSDRDCLEFSIRKRI